MPARPTFLGIIPARGGSKGVPKKNIRPLAGRPLLAYTARQVSQASMLTDVVVSTDDDDIARVAEDEGLTVIKRPSEFAADSSPTEHALIHVLDTLQASGKSYDFVVVLEPTSPLRSPATIDGACRRIMNHNARSLLAVVAVHEIVGEIEDGFFRPYVPNQPRRRQERKPAFRECSTIYVCDIGFLRTNRSLVAQDWLAYPVPTGEALDINSFEDFRLVETLMRLREVDDE